MSGTFYAVGVGPGDPELLTLKAIRKIQECPVLAVPISNPKCREPIGRRIGVWKNCDDVATLRAEKSWRTEAKTQMNPEHENRALRATQHFRREAGQQSEKDGVNTVETQTEQISTEEAGWLEKCAAYQILLGADLDLSKKEILYLPMPMIRDKELLRECHDRCAKRVMEILDEGLDIACVTLGDPSIYATTSYIKVRLDRNGYATALIPGVPSFCAAAAGLNVTLAENKEEMHILPASYEIEKGLSLSGTKVLMKTASRTMQVREAIEKRGLEAVMAENCGMEQEHFYHKVEEIPDKTSYYSLYIVKDAKEETK